MTSFLGVSLRPGLFLSLGFHKFPKRFLCGGTKVLSQKFNSAAVLSEGSWKYAFNIGPSDWLCARRSAWLLFGLCACFSAAGSVAPNVTSGRPAYAESLTDRSEFDQADGARVSHGKPVHTKYSVIGIPGDGRCLFRAIAHGAEVRCGKAVPSESLQREYADNLRQKVVDELVKHREETEWFIEGDFDTYTKRMRQPYVWGGEPELLMASRVLKAPITVYMYEEKSRGLISIAEYGQEYGKENPTPIRVLYHGFGHYDALHFPSS